MMNLIRYFLALSLALAPISAKAWIHGGSPFNPFNTTLNIGAGGWLVGGDIATDGTTIARPDTYGAYKLRKVGTCTYGGIPNAAPCWDQIISQTSMPAADFGYAPANGSTSQINTGIAPVVEEICQAPGNSSIVYMMWNGFMFKSVDGALTWTKQTSFNSGTQVSFVTTGSYRFNGRRCAVDPQNANYVYFGTDNNGLFVTTDGGTTWAAVSTASIPQSTSDGGGQFPSYNVAFDPSALHTCGAGSNQTCTVYVCNFVNGGTGGIYATTNAGTGWTKTPSTPTSCQHLVVAPTGGTVWIVDTANNPNGGQVDKYTGGTAGTWTVGPGSIGAALYHSIAVDPADATHVIAFAGGTDGGSPNSSSNTGGSWTGKLAFTQTCGAGEPTWLCYSNDRYMSNGDTIFDPSQSHVMTFFMGVGVWSAPAGTAVSTYAWSSISKGIEQLVGRVVSVSNSNNPVVGVADRATFYLGSANTYPSQQNTTFFNAFSLMVASWIDWAASNSNFLVARITDFVLNQGEVSGTSSDGGVTWTPFNSYLVDVDATTALSSGTAGVIKVTVPSTAGLSNWSAGSGSIVRTLGYNPAAGITPNNIGNGYWYVQNIVSNTSFELKNSSFAGNNLTGKIRIYAETEPRSDWNGALRVTNVTNNGSGLIRVTTAGGPFISGGMQLCVSGVLGVTAANGCWITSGFGSGPTYDLLNSAFSGTYTPISGVVTAYANLSGSAAVGSTSNFVIIPSNSDYPVCTQDAGQTWTTLYFPSAPRPARITAATWAATSGGQITFTTDNAHGIAIGSQVSISNMLPSGYNGTYTLLAGSTGTTMIVTQVSNPGAQTQLGLMQPWLNGSATSGYGFAAFLNRVIVTADKTTPNTFYAYNFLSGVYKIVNCTATLVSGTNHAGAGAGTPTQHFMDNNDEFNAVLKSAPGNAGHLFFTSGIHGTAADTHPANQNFYRSMDGGVTWDGPSHTDGSTGMPRVREVVAAGFGATGPSQSYPTMYIIGFYDTTGAGNWVFSLWRSTNANATTPTWSNVIAAQKGVSQDVPGYSINSMDQAVDLSGDPAVWNKWYMCWTNSGCSYGQQN